MNAQKKILAVIAQAEGISGMILAEYEYRPPKTVRTMIDRLKSACGEAYQEWPMALSEKDINLINNIYKTVMINTLVASTMYCPYVIHLLIDILAHVTNPARRKRLEAVLSAILAINNYYDRNVTRDSDYFLAMSKGEKFLRLCDQS